MAFDIASSLKPSTFDPVGIMQDRERNALAQQQNTRANENQAMQRQIYNNQLDQQKQQKGAALTQGIYDAIDRVANAPPGQAAEALRLLASTQPEVGRLAQDLASSHNMDINTFDDSMARELAGNVANHFGITHLIAPAAPKYQIVNPGDSAVNMSAPGGPSVAYTAPAKPVSAGTQYQYVGPNGKPMYGSAEDVRGKTPYDKPTAYEAGAGSLTAQGIELAAQDYRLNGKLPSGISRIPGASLKIINTAADQAASVGDSAQESVLRRQSVAAGKAALSKITTQKALVGAFEKTAAKNIDLTLSLSDKLDRSGSPLINKGIMAFRQNVSGDPETAAFVNALTAARTEYAKVLSGATGAAGITDSARTEAHELFSKISNKETLQAVFGVAKQEMNNRMTSFDDQISEINQSVSGPSAAPSQPPDKEITATGPNGKKLALRNGQWVPL